MNYKADITVIGGGVVGLAIAAKAAGNNREILVLEKNGSFGLETSSRNSGVIHSGIYYPGNSLKAKMCVAGKNILYDLCERQGIGHKRIGKLIIASNDEETKGLQALFETGKKNGIKDLQILSRQQIKKLEPNIEGVAAILSPSTGIINSHELMKYFISTATCNGVQIIYQTKLTGIEKITGGYKVTVKDGTEELSFITRIVVNSAGLYSDQIAELAGIDIDKEGYRLYYCRGEYYSVTGSKNKLTGRLIYPMPQSEITGLGIHINFDLEGRMRLGPSTEYVDNINYAVDERNKKLFYESARRIIPSINYDDLAPEMAGIRPKIQKSGGQFRDFIIRDERDKNLPGFINLIGIESPGLTAAPAIAEYVNYLIEVYL